LVPSSVCSTQQLCPPQGTSTNALVRATKSPRHQPRFWLNAEA
jgi:hypothetical protein